MHPRLPAASLRLSVLTLALWGAAPGLALAQPAPAAASARSYDIPAQPLGSTLTRIAAESGAPISVDADIVRGIVAPAVRGRFTAAQAVQAAIVGSGLVPARTGSGALTVVRGAGPEPAPAPAAATAAAVATALPEVRVTAEAERDGRTEGTDSYTGRGKTGTTRLGLTLRETPQSVSVITRQKMDDQGLTTLDQVLERTPGITVQTSGNVTTNYYSRGFEMAVTTDGLSSGYSTGERGLVNTNMYDRIEVLRGAAGLMTGAGQPGGVVNLVPKRPTKTRQLLVGAQYGSWNERRGELDLSGPLDADGSLRARAVISYDAKNYFYDIAKNRNAGVYATLEKDLTPDTLLSAGFSRYERDAVPEITGVPRKADGSESGIDPRRYLGAAWNRWSVDTTTAFARIEHHFDDDWKLKLHGKREHRLLNYKRAFYGTTGLNLSDMSFTRMEGYYSGDMTITDKALEASLEGAFTALGRRHELMFGASRQEVVEPRPWTSLTPIVLGTTPLRNFDPHAVPEPVTGPVAASSELVTVQSAAFGMVRLNPVDRLHVILGARLGTWRYHTLNYASGVRGGRYENRGVVTPYAGIVYDLDETWMAYASYTDVFRSQANSFTFEGSRLDPAVGANYEAGVKGEWLGGRLNASFAVFQIQEENRAIADPDHPDPTCGLSGSGTCYINAGEVRSRGFEAEVTGQLRPGWQIAAGYTFNNTKYLRDSTANTGRGYSPYTPRHLVRLWSSWKPPVDNGRWTVGGGVNVQSEIWNQSGNVRIVQPGYALWSAFVAWQLTPQWKLSLNVDNLFDKGYYRKLGTVSSGNYYGTPRNALLSLRGAF